MITLSLPLGTGPALVFQLRTVLQLSVVPEELLPVKVWVFGCMGTMEITVSSMIADVVFRSLPNVSSITAPAATAKRRVPATVPLGVTDTVTTPGDVSVTVPRVMGASPALVKSPASRVAESMSLLKVRVKVIGVPSSTCSPLLLSTMLTGVRTGNTGSWPMEMTRSTAEP